MAPTLCKVCRSIPSSFWTQDLRTTKVFDLHRGLPDDCPRVQLQPYRRLEDTADKGCQLCQMILSDNFVLKNLSPLNPEVATTAAVELSRVKTAEMGLSLLRVHDDNEGYENLCFRIGDKGTSSNLCCYRIPPFWSKSPSPRMQTNEAVSDVGCLLR